MRNGQSVQVRGTASNSYSATATVALTIGGRSGDFTMTTVSAPVSSYEPPASDTTPDAFDIANMTNQTLSTVVTTNAITVAGLNASVTASTTAGTIVKNGTDSGSASTTVVNGDTVAIKLTTSGSNSTAINGTLTIGTGATSTDTFSITTIAAAPDTTTPTTSAHSVANVTDTTADIRATIDEAGTGYYVVQLAATAAPSVVQIVAGQDGSGAAAPKSGNAAMTAATQKVFSVSGLAVSTNYTAYFVAKDAANNLQAAAVSDALNTAADGAIPATPSLSINSGNPVNKAYADANTTGGFIDVSVTISGDTDNVGVTGWFVSESSSVPVLASFVTPKPGVGKVSTGDGIKTLYITTRDAAGNISLGGWGTVKVDTTALALSSITPESITAVAGTPTTGNTITLDDSDCTIGSITGFKIRDSGDNSIISSNALNPGTVTVTGKSGGTLTLSILWPNGSPSNFVYIEFTTTDDAGNTGPVVRTVGDFDVTPILTPPSAPTFTTTPPVATKLATTPIPVSGRVGTKIYINGVDSGAVMGAGGTGYAPLDTSGTDRTIAYSITLVDAGGTSSPLTGSIRKDTIALAISYTVPEGIVSSAGNTTINNTITLDNTDVKTITGFVLKNSSDNSVTNGSVMGTSIVGNTLTLSVTWPVIPG